MPGTGTVTLVRPFGLNGDRLARFEIYRTPTALWLFEDIHHIICDGSSSAVLSDGIRRALDGMEPEAEKISVFDIAKAEEEWLASEDAKKAREYWEGLLSGCEAPSEPERDRWEDTPKQAWLTREFSLDEERFSALREKAGCSASAFFTGAFAYVTSIFTGQKDVLFNTFYSARDEENANTFSMIVRTIPFCAHIGDQDSVDSFLSAVNTELSDSRLNSGYPYLKFAETYGLKPWMEFAYQRDVTENALISGCDIEVERLYDEAHVEASPVLLKDEPELFIPESGIALGLFEDAGLRDHTMTFRPGQGILLYTGVTLHTIAPELSSFETVKRDVFAVAGDNEKTRRALLACDEALTNIIDHSGATQLKYSCDMQNGRLRVFFLDNGCPFDPTKAEIEEKEFDLLENGGMGLGIIRQSAESADYERMNGLNMLTLHFIV